MIAFSVYKDNVNLAIKTFLKGKKIKAVDFSVQNRTLDELIKL